MWLWALLAGCAQAPGQQPPDWDSALRLPEPEDLAPDPNVLEVVLEARVATLTFVEGGPTEVWTYNGSVPGPLLRAKRGDRLVVHFQNHLPEATTLHWHGLRVPAAMDGSSAVQTPVPPGGTFEYSFDLLDAGTYWYHPHVRSSAQVGYGLYGAIVVEDPDEPALGDDVTLVLSDLGVADDGALLDGASDGWFGDYFGREGNLVLLNGKRAPTLRAHTGVPQRWRLVNASRARYQRVVVPGQQLFRIAGDGGLLEKPEAVESVTLVPGERAEVVVVPRPQDGPVIVLSEDPQRFGPTVPPRPPDDLFSFEVLEPKSAAPGFSLPAHLRSIPALETANATLQQVTLEEVPGDGGTVLGINGHSGADMAMLHASVNTTQVWTVTNATVYDHPFHLHGFFFQVLDAGGATPALREWKDTVNVPGKATLRLGIWFDDRPGLWMFHCHILDHADMGMMAMLMLM